MNTTENEIKSLLLHHKKICVYGLSPNPSKPSHQIALFLKAKGYDVVGVNPNETQISGISIYPNLAATPLEYRKFIDVFQRSEKVPDVVNEILKLNDTEVLWLQLGITHPQAENQAESAGLKVISDRCILIEYKKHF
jgi:predicted CoA-binding protein